MNNNVELDPESNLSNFLANLPQALYPYIRKPVANHITFADQVRSPINKLGRQIAATLLFPYTLVRNILVEDKTVALVWDNGKAVIYGPGRHALFSPTTKVHSVVSINQPLIQHGTMTLVRVVVGNLGYGINTDTGDPVILSPGFHVIDSPSFRFKSFIDISEEKNDIGTLKLIRVETGKIGYVYRNGRLEILQPGRLHLIVPPDRFGGFLSTQQLVLDLPKSVHESSDYVELCIAASLFYRIVDPKKALENIKDIDIQVQETAIATLAGIIRSTSLAEIAQNTTPVYKKSEQPDLCTVEPTAPPFYQKVHDMFLQELHDYVLRDWGIEINNIRIESLKIQDSKLSKDIAQQAITVSQLEVKYNMLQKQSAITETEARMSTNANMIKAEGDAHVLLQKTETEGKAMIRMAEAKKQTKSLETEASSLEIIKLAEAKKQAKILEGEGQRQFIDSISSNKYGPMLAQLKIQQEALAGMKQVAYLPQSQIPKLLTQGMFSDGKFDIPELN